MLLVLELLPALAAVVVAFIAVHLFLPCLPFCSFFFLQVCGPPGMMKFVSGDKAPDKSQGEVCVQFPPLYCTQSKAGVVYTFQYSTVLYLTVLYWLFSGVQKSSVHGRGDAVVIWNCGLSSSFHVILMQASMHFLPLLQAGHA